MENHTAKRGGTQSGSGGKKDLRELAGERRHKKRDSTSKKRPKELSQPSSGSDQPIQSQSVNPSGNKTPGTVTSKEPSLLQQLISKVSLKSHNSKETSPEAVGDEDIVEVGIIKKQFCILREAFLIQNVGFVNLSVWFFTFLVSTQAIEGQGFQQEQ